MVALSTTQVEYITFTKGVKEIVVERDGRRAGYCVITRSDSQSVIYLVHH